MGLPTRFVPPSLSLSLSRGAVASALLTYYTVYMCAKTAGPPSAASALANKNAGFTGPERYVRVRQGGPVRVLLAPFLVATTVRNAVKRRPVDDVTTACAENSMLKHA